MLPQSPSASASSPPPPTVAASTSGAASPTAELKLSAQSPEHQQSSSAPQKRGFMSRWFGSSPTPEASASAAGNLLYNAAAKFQNNSVGSVILLNPHIYFDDFFSEDIPAAAAPVCPAKVHSVDDFVPDERLDKSFLEDSLPKTKVPQPAPPVDSDR